MDGNHEDFLTSTVVNVLEAVSVSPNQGCWFMVLTISILKIGSNLI